MKRFFKIVALLLVVIVGIDLVFGMSSPAAPKPRCRAEIEAVLSQAPKPPAEKDLKELNIVLVAKEKDHGDNEHDYQLWQKRYWKPVYF